MMLDVALRAVRILLFDVDGILTDNGLFIGENGEAIKRFDIRDGAGIKIAQAAGLEIGLISGHASGATLRRAKDLGIAEAHVGAKEKLPVFDSILAARGLEPANALFMGDDLMDLPLLRRAGVAATVPEAPTVVRAVCSIVTTRPGGHGAVREVIERVLAAQGLWDAVVARFH